MTKAQLLAVGSTAELESGGEQGLLTFEFPKHMEHPAGRVNLTAAYLLEYWASKGTIPRYDGVIDGLLAGAAEIFKVAKPVRSNDLYPAEPDGRYAWGQESVLIAAHISADDD